MVKPSVPLKVAAVIIPLTLGMTFITVTLFPEHSADLLPVIPFAAMLIFALVIYVYEYVFRVVRDKGWRYWMKGAVETILTFIGWVLLILLTFLIIWALTEGLKYVYDALTSSDSERTGRVVTGIWVILGAVCIWLITRPWFWLIIVSLGALASFFAMCASVIHFQILGAMGFFFLTAILASIAQVIASARY